MENTLVSMKNKKKRGINLKKEYAESWKYLWSSKKYIQIVFYVFVVFAIIGFFVPVPELIADKILTFLKEIIEQTKDLGFFGLFKFIFLNNVKSSFFGIVLGIVFGIFSILIALANGFLLGFVASLSVRAENIFVLWRIFPHGVFELPALFISLGLGLRLGFFVFEDTSKRTFKQELLNSGKAFLLIVIPLLFIAGVIESLFLVSFSG